LIIGRSTGDILSNISRDTKTIMEDAGKKYYSMEFAEEGGKTYVLFYDSEDNLVAKKEIPHQDVTEAIRFKQENN